MRRVVLFLALFAFSMVALIPLRLAAGWFGADGRGLAAREAEGSLWMGALKEAQFGPVPLGDLHARLNVLPLLIGRARLSLWRDEADGRIAGAVTVSRHGFGVDDLTGQVQLGTALAPLPVTALDLHDVSARFAGGLCESAGGMVQATLSGQAGGMTLPAGMRGEARCAEGALLIPLASDSGTEQVNLSIRGDGRYNAELVVRPSDPDLQAALVAAGFAPGQNGYVRRLDGSF